MQFLKIRLEKGSLKGPSGTKGIGCMFSLRAPFVPLEDTTWIPEADLYETQHYYILKVNVAGVSRDNLDLTLYEDCLRVSGVRMMDLFREEPLCFHRLEMGQGRFERSFRVPADADLEDIEAVLADGILTVKIGKRVYRGVKVV